MGGDKTGMMRWQMQPIRGSSLAIAILLLGNSLVTSAEQYLCVADKGVGFSYNEQRKQWENAIFNVEDNKYIISDHSKYTVVFGERAFFVTEIGEEVPMTTCKEGFDELGYLYCTSFGHIFSFIKTMEGIC